MKKSLIALAVAGVVAAPAAFAATANVDAYGKVRVSVNVVEGDWSMSDQTSRLGFKGSEDLGGGLKALWQVESGFSAAGAQSGTIGSRNTFVGLSGGFGTVLAGRHDTPYKLAGSADVFADTLADAQHSTKGIIGRNGGPIGFDARLDNALAYITPDFNGFHAAAAVSPNGDELTDAYSLALVYANGPLKATLGYEDHNNLADESAVKVNVGYKFGDIGLGATWEDISGVTSANDSTNWLVSATYGMGPITLAAQYGDNEYADLKRTTIGMIYGLSKRTNVAVAYNNDDAATDTDGFTVQLNHDF